MAVAKRGFKLHRVKPGVAFNSVAWGLVASRGGLGLVSDMSRVVRILVGVGLVVGLGAGAYAYLSRNPGGLSLKAIGQAAGQGYVFGFPLVLMDETRTAMFAAQRVTALNKLTHGRRGPTHESRLVIRPNLDTLYSVAWLDLSEGPVTLSWPEMGERYWLFQVLDAWTDVAGRPGSLDLGGDAGSIVIVGPGQWPVPSDVPKIEVATRMAWIIGRIATTRTPGDLAAVHAMQDGFRLTSSATVTFDGASVASKRRPPDTVSSLPAVDFFQRMAELLAANPARPEDSPIVERLASIGIRPGSTSFDDMGPLAMRAVERGVEVARKRLADAIMGRTPGRTGWLMPSSKLGDYGTDYGTRAGVALLGLGANKPIDAIYPLGLQDADGQPLNGRHVYRLRFERGALPPADAFWSVTAYDGEGWLMPVERNSLGDRDELVFEDDGALEIIIGAERPTWARPNNFLPVQAGRPFQITGRLYDPRPDARDGRWLMPPLERVPADGGEQRPPAMTN